MAQKQCLSIVIGYLEDRLAPSSQLAREGRAWACPGSPGGHGETGDPEDNARTSTMIFSSGGAPMLHRRSLGAVDADRAARFHDVAIRPARPEDAVECVVLRGQTRENAVSRERLKSLGITAQSWAEDIRTGELPGHICLAQGRMVGYGFGSRSHGEVVVLALLPSFEARGIGKELLRRVCGDLIALGHERLFLGCSSDPKSRSYGFYRHLGWRSTGAFDARGDEILEYVPRS
jgi:GNAT superfamily N-acetyltransferase